MNRYEIEKIHVTGYDRFLIIRNSDNIRFGVHFVEFEELIIGDAPSKLRHVGDNVYGNLYIDLVCNSYKTEEPIRHTQKEEFSVGVDAVVRVVKIIDEYTLLAESDIEDQIIRIEFEDKVDYKVNDVIFVAGSLELEMDELKDKTFS